MRAPRFWFVCLFVLALTPRILYLASIPHEAILESVDARGYDLLARNLLSGYGFSLSDDAPYQPDGLRVPLYPVFVAGVYMINGITRDANHIGPVMVATAQALLDGLTALIVGATAGTLLGRRAGVAAAILYALTPVQWRYAASLLPEVPLAFLVALTVWLLVHFVQKAERSMFWATACGVTAGLAALCKPNLSGLAPIVACAALWSASIYHWQGHRLRIVFSLRSAGVMLLAAAAVVSPWIVRNQIVFGRPFLSNAGLGFVARVSAPATLGILEGHQVPTWSLEWEARYHAIVTQTAARFGWNLAPEAPLSPQDADRRERDIAHVAWEILRAHPLGAARAHLIGVFRSWAPVEQAFWYAHLSGRPWEENGVPANTYRDAAEILLDGRPIEAFELGFVRPWKQLDQLGRTLWYTWGFGHLFVMGLMVIGVWRLGNRPALATAITAIILYATLLPGPIGYVRFRVSVMPLITILMLSTLVWLYTKLQLFCPYSESGIFGELRARGKNGT
jgi:4-amino-4-deoxy-L-arabinose transferase-like glycosyltransferase